MAKLTTLPNGNAISMPLVTSITLYPGKGVSCRDESNACLPGSRSKDIEKAKQVRQTPDSTAQPGVGGVDPDWGFLDE